MRKIFLLVFTLISLSVFGQFPNDFGISNSKTQYYVKGGMGADSSFIFRTAYADTTAANRGFQDAIPGCIIRTTGGFIWMRNDAATAWIYIGGSAGGGTNIYNSDGTLTGNRNVYINGSDLSFYSAGIASGKVLYFSPTSNYIGNPTSTRQLLLYPDSVLLVNTDQSASSSDSVLVRTSTGRLKTRAQSQISATIPISSLLAATVTNDIDNTNYTQTWRWTGTTLNALELYNSTTASLTNTRTLYVSRSGAHASSNRQTFAGQFANAHTGTNSTNIGISGIAGAGTINKSGYFAASTAGTTNYAIQAEWTTNGGTDNYGGHFTSSGVGTNNIAGYFSATNGTSRNDAIIVPSGGGNVGIGTSSPAKVFHTVGTVRHGSLGTASSDTTTYKPVGINSSGDIIGMTYWPGSGGGGITGSGSANQITYWTGASSVSGDADMTFNGTTNTITLLPNGTDNGQINFSTGYGRTAIMLYDGGAGVRHGWGLQPSEMQFFNPTAAHFSWNLGGDLQTSGTNEIMRLYSPGSMAGQLNLRDPNGTYSGLTNNGGPLTIFGSSTYNDVQVSVGSSTAIRAYHPTSFNYIYLNGQVINNDLTVLSNYVGAYSLQRTVPYAVGGDNYHGYTDNTDFRLGTAAFNSFGSFVTFGNNTTNADHYAAFQNVWKKDSSNTMSKVYGFVNAVSEITGGAITDLYGYYHYSPTITSGTITNQYGVYVPAVTGATNNYGAYFGSNVGIGTATPSTPLHLVNTTEQARIGYDGSNYYKTTVGSTGGVTFDAVGSGANFTFSDAVTLGNLPSGSTSDSVLTDASGAVKHRKVSDLISPYVTTGTYTPTLSNTTNVSASTAYQCQYSVAADASGNQVVTVSGEVDIDPTTTATLTVLRVTLPITSNVGQTYEVGGTANDELGTPARIRGNAANDVAEIRFTPVDVTNRTFSFVFVYKVNIP